MLQKQAVKFFFFSAALSVAIMSCERDNDVVQDTPSRHIAASENLVIPAAVDLPANLPGGNSRVATYYAVGVQKYKAQAKAGGGFEWVLVAPVADLYNAGNTKVGTHTAGPTWQLSATDSIYGQHFAPVRSAPSTEPNTIDWLLLMPKTGKTPTGVFANVAYIQRIATKGGKAPVAAPQNANETTEVAYTAVYRFTKKNS